MVARPGSARSTLLALTACGLAMITIAGCATTIEGNPKSRPGATGRSQPGGPPAGAAPAASVGLGDPTTLDPCGFTDPAVFAVFGTASFGVPDSLDDCLVEIRTSAATEPVRLYVGSLDRVEALPDLNSKPSADTGAGTRVVSYETGSHYCNQLFVLPEGITMSVNAAQYDGNEPRLCDMVTAGMHHAVQVFAVGPVKHRELAANSLGRLDPCLLVPADALAAVPGIASVAAKSYPARHGCAWTAPDGTRLRVMFTVGPPPRPAADGSTESSIAGRSSVRSPAPEAGSYVFCGVQAAHIPFSANGQTGLVEIAAVSVRMPKGKVDAACTAANAVATAVWPKLPQA